MEKTEASRQILPKAHSNFSVNHHFSGCFCGDCPLSVNQSIKCSGLMPKRRQLTRPHKFAIFEKLEFENMSALFRSSPQKQKIGRFVNLNDQTTQSSKRIAAQFLKQLG